MTNNTTLVCRRNFFEITSGIYDISPDAEAQASDDDEERDSEGDDGIGGVMGKRNEFFASE